MMTQKQAIYRQQLTERVEPMIRAALASPKKRTVCLALADLVALRCLLREPRSPQDASDQIDVLSQADSLAGSLLRAYQRRHPATASAVMARLAAVLGDGGENLPDDVTVDELVELGEAVAGEFVRPRA